MIPSAFLPGGSAPEEEWPCPVAKVRARTLADKARRGRDMMHFVPASASTRFVSNTVTENNTVTDTVLFG